MNRLLALQNQINMCMHQQYPHSYVFFENTEADIQFVLFIIPYAFSIFSEFEFYMIQYETTIYDWNYNMLIWYVNNIIHIYYILYNKLQIISRHEIKRQIKEWNFIYNYYRAMVLFQHSIIPGPFVFRIINVANN